MIEEFKKFALRGNVVDLAIGVVIGAAFTSIVNSLVNDILMPIIGIFIGKIDFSSYKFAGIAYGKFINAVVEFFIVAFVLFIIIKQINKMRGEPKSEENNKLCRFCKSSISKYATRCPFCTSLLKEG